MTEYVVLHYIDHEQTWRRVGDSATDDYVVHARSARAAVQEWLKDDTIGGTFVALPYRSWKPVTVKVETKTALKFS